jgi:hypothetical protein
MSEPLGYDELRSNEIRLIELLPGENDARVECRLFTSSLENHPEFEALSYVWGDPTVTTTISYDGRDMSVTMNLARALERLRHQDKDCSRILWADAICINQSNTAEKNLQVPLMSQIYSGATGVLVWMGLEETVHVLEALAIIDFVHSRCEALRDASINPYEHLEFAEINEFVAEKKFGNAWASLRIFLTAPYWERVWCVQEVALAQKSSLIVGSKVIEQRTITNFASWYALRYEKEAAEGKEPDANLPPGVAVRVRMMLGYNKSALEGEDLYLTLDNFRYARATDLRDKVYGLLGIHAKVSGTQTTIEVDYGKTVAEVYTETVLQPILKTRRLHVLSYLEHNTAFEGSGFPSWVPRWDRALSRGYSKMLNLGTPISAGRHEATISDGRSVLSGTLSLQGVLIDTTDFVSGVLPGATWLEKHRGFRYLFAQLWSQANERISTFPHSICVKELATTLTCGFAAFRGDSEDGTNVLQDLDSEFGRKFLADFYSFVQMMELPVFHFDSSQGDGQSYAMQAGLMCHPRRIFRTSTGYLGLGPGCMQKGDVVVVLDGGKVPYMLRPRTGSQYAFLGECYVYAIRNGEAYDMAEKRGVGRQMFSLV